jgi:hypothetical protein
MADVVRMMAVAAIAVLGVRAVARAVAVHSGSIGRCSRHSFVGDVLNMELRPGHALRVRADALAHASVYFVTSRSDSLSVCSSHQPADPSARRFGVLRVPAMCAAVAAVLVWPPASRFRCR